MGQEADGPELEPVDGSLPPAAEELLDRLLSPEKHASLDDKRWQYVDWKGKQLSVPDIALLGQHILMPRPQTAKIRNLDLSGSLTVRAPDGSHAGVSALARVFLAGALPSLRDLTLSENALGDDDGVRLVAALSDAEFASSLELLKLQGNDLGDKFARALSGGDLPELTAVYLSDNKISDQGAACIANGSWPRLSRIQLQNNLFGDEAVDALGKAAAEPEGPMSSLIYVTLDSYQHNLVDLRNKETIVRIGGAITKLDLAGQDDQGKARDPMSNLDLQFVCWFLRQPGRMVKLDLFKLHENQIGAAGCSALADVMCDEHADSLRSLGQLHLTSNPVGDMGAKLLMAPMSSGGAAALPNLRELHLGSCGIGDKGAAAVAKALASEGACQHLKLLSLGQNKIADDGCTAIADAIQTPGAVPVLTGLYLGRNAISDAGGVALASTLAATFNGIALHPVPCAPMLAQLHLFGNRLTSVSQAAIESATKARNQGQDASSAAKRAAKRTELVVELQ